MSKSSSVSSSKSRSGKSALRRKDNAGEGEVTAIDSEQTSNQLDDATRRAMIAEAAYYRAERRGFAPGFEVEDWLLSENELEAQAPTRIQEERLEKSTSSSAELH